MKGEWLTQTDFHELLPKGMTLEGQKSKTQHSSDSGRLPEALPFQQVSFAGCILPSKDLLCQNMVSYEQRQT